MSPALASSKVTPFQIFDKSGGGARWTTVERHKPQDGGGVEE
jgi:hypothetical protein